MEESEPPSMFFFKFLLNILSHVVHLKICNLVYIFAKEYLEGKPIGRLHHRSKFISRASVNKIWKFNYEVFGHQKPRHFISGFIQIQEWTKRSLLERQYGSAKGRMWIEEGHPVPEDICNNYQWIRRAPLKARTFRENYYDKPVTRILAEEEVGNSGPIKILLKGKDKKKTRE